MKSGVYEPEPLVYKTLRALCVSHPIDEAPGDGTALTRLRDRDAPMTHLITGMLLLLALAATGGCGGDKTIGVGSLQRGASTVVTAEANADLAAGDRLVNCTYADIARVGGPGGIVGGDDLIAEVVSYPWVSDYDECSVQVSLTAMPTCPLGQWEVSVRIYYVSFFSYSYSTGNVKINVVARFQTPTPSPTAGPAS